MLRDRKLAATILRALFRTGASLDRSIAIVKAKGGAAAFNAYRAAVGHVMGELWVRAINPLLQSHPTLAPNEKNRATPKSKRSSARKAQSKRRSSGSPGLPGKRARASARQR